MIKNKTAAAMIIFIAAVLFNSCTTKQNTYGAIGVPATSHDGKYTALLIAESEGTTHQENGGFRPTNYITTYWLKLYETATGKLLKTKKLFVVKEPENFSMLCFGGYDDKIWLHGDGLKAYNINNLEETANQQTLAAANNFNANDFPDDERFIDAVLDKGYINFMSFNNQRYRLNLTDLKITQRDAAEKEAVKSISAILHPDEYGLRCDTCNNSFFALAKNAAQAMDYSPAYSDNKEVWYRMYLFTAAYNIKRLGNHDSFTFSDVKQQGSRSYLNACFLKNTSSGNIIRLLEPAGYLILHQDTVGSTAKAILTRIDISNNKIWETATGVSTKIGECIVSGKYCIVTSNTDYMLSPHIGKDALCIIDLETGKIIRPGLAL